MVDWAGMSRKEKKEKEPAAYGRRLVVLSALLVVSVAIGAGYFLAPPGFYDKFYSSVYTRPVPPPPRLDTVAYDAKLLALAHLASTTPFSSIATTTATSSPHTLWPVHAVYPNFGALLPSHRIVAYYGNFYSTAMGVLGQYPPQEMLTRLQSAAGEWQQADPSTPVIPAIDYIAVVAQGAAGKDGKYIARMPDSQIDEALELAKQAHGIVILDIQVGLSSVEVEAPLLEKYLAMPNVELALDPEFAMHNGQRPGHVIGSLDASDVNAVAAYLAGLVRAHHLPPKILLVHRFTDAMVTNAEDIKPLPEVQIVMDMDGWGSPARKQNTYRAEVQLQPVQFTGFKLFYKNDLLPPSSGMMTPSEVLQLTPSPSFIQYQ